MKNKTFRWRGGEWPQQHSAHTAALVSSWRNTQNCFRDVYHIPLSHEHNAFQISWPTLGLQVAVGNMLPGSHFSKQADLIKCKKITGLLRKKFIPGRKHLKKSCVCVTYRELSNTFLTYLKLFGEWKRSFIFNTSTSLLLKPATHFLKT